MNSIVRWYRSNYVQITWFIIGWLAMVAVVDFGKGDWAGVAWDIGLAWLNYIFYKNN